ncbi:uncharacterized protein BDZ99DRAFT_382142 [Mytilinidion resinicola]|uniref:CorA-like transporter domain-containing protein n=1 Tax=Mytilinidion resinicola TaxID=574789 RepID=A0A6A6YVW1_9PEZI|nr:uncharacterized protein BDZ99DRAFT_382142 [Mytilinidion resinicola]KAF2813082.1 hypothetical protein BDZ99DRAFT_382142 [Mytilinidion resinicola]
MYESRSSFPMDQLISSCERFESYPQNLVRHYCSPHALKTYFDRLQDEKDRLFSEENKAALDFFDLNDGDDGEFIHALHSRDRLRVSHRMFTFALTYFQVMAPLLDFVFPFGAQEQAQDSHFSGFRDDDYLSNADGGLCVSEIGRSGRSMRLCYNLRSVEPSKGQVDLPWSIRQTTIYHSFDITSGGTLWINVKGNKLLKRRISEASKQLQALNPRSFDSTSGAFASALATHLIFCNWSGENWRWYLNDLEREAQSVTRKALSAPIDETPSPVSINALSTFSQARTATMMTESSWKTLSSKLSLRKQQEETANLPEPLREKTEPRKNPSIMRADRLTLPPRVQNEGSSTLKDDFSFSDLQRIQYIEEKTNEVLLVLKLNSEVLRDLKEHYRSVIRDPQFPSEISLKCHSEFARFEKCISGVEKDLRMQLSRTETLLCLLAERKSLLYGILQYRSMKASEFFARKSQLSAHHMEKMTTSMHEIARKTKQETVSMRIITLVTLFFLPGTFIATIFSTDIIKFSTDNQGHETKAFQFQGLQLYMEICIPLMFVTFIAWYIVYWWVKRGDRSEPWVSAEDELCEAA